MESKENNNLTANKLTFFKESVYTSSCSKTDGITNNLKETESFTVSDGIETDVKTKLSKLEEYSRQLCLNLKNLQKNRAKLSNEAAALTQELEATQEEDIDENLVSSDSDFHVLLDAKQHVQGNHVQKITNVFSCELMRCQSCENCTCVECESSEETVDDDRLTIFHDIWKKEMMFREENDCHCVRYGSSNESSEYLCERCDGSNSISVTSVITTVAFATNDENETRTSMNQAKTHFCCNCKSEERFVKAYEFGERVNDGNHSKNVCRVPYGTEERCRGGFDRVEGQGEGKSAVSTPATGNESKPKECEGCECNLCALRNVEGSLPPCLTNCCKSSERLNDNDDAGVDAEENCDNLENLAAFCEDAPVKLQQICKVEKMREVLEQLKNRNHAMRKMIDNGDPDCSISEAENFFLMDSAGINEKKENIGRTTSELITTVKNLQEKCRAKDGMIMALVDVLKKDSSFERTERILANLAKVDDTNDFPSADFDRSELWKCLRLGNTQNNIRQERVSGDVKTSKPKNIIAGLGILFLIIFSYFYRCHEYCFDLVYWILDRVTNVILVFYDGWVQFIRKFNQEFSDAASITHFFPKSMRFKKYFSFISSHVTSVGGVFGSLSFINTVWTLARKLIVWYQVSSSITLNVPPWLRKFVKSIKKSALWIIFYVKSKYYLASYLFCLTLGFLVSKLSNVIDKSSEIPADIIDENVFIEIADG